MKSGLGFSRRPYAHLVEVQVYFKHRCVSRLWDLELSFGICGISGRLLGKFGSRSSKDRNKPLTTPTGFL